MLNAGRGVDGRFDNAGDTGVHYIRVGAPQYGVDHNNGEINRRNTVDTNALISD